MRTATVKRSGLPPITILTHEACSAKLYSAERRKNGHTYAEHTLVYSEAGKRVRRTFADLGEAKREAEIILTRLANGQKSALTLTNADAEAYGLAKQEAARAGVPLLEAVREYRAAASMLAGCATLHSAIKEYRAAFDQLHGRATLNEAIRFFVTNGATDVPTKKIGEIVAEFMQAKAADGASKVHLTDLRLRLAKFAEKFDHPITDIATRDIEEWLRGLKTGARNRNNFAAVVTNLFRFARRCGYLPSDRATAADSLQRAKGKGSAIEIFTPDEVRKMLDRLRQFRPELVPPVAIGAFAGLRTAEIARLDWSDIKFDQGHIVVGADKAKTAQRRLVPILPNLAQWLAPYRKADGKICSFKRTAYVIQREVHAPMKIEGRAEPGIAWKHNGLRHSFASYRLAMTKNAAEVSLEMGNSPRMVFQHYRELVTMQEAAAYWAIEPKEKV